MFSLVTFVVGGVIGSVFTHFGYKEVLAQVKSDLLNAEIKVRTLLTRV